MLYGLKHEEPPCQKGLVGLMLWGKSPQTEELAVALPNLGMTSSLRTGKLQFSKESTISMAMFDGYVNIAKWKMTIDIVIFPVKDGDFLVRCVKLPEGTSHGFRSNVFFQTSFALQ